jgi:hypothetical protein
MTPAAFEKAKRAVLTVGVGRGFVVERRLVISAAHCLPQLPEPHPWAERTYWKLLATLGTKPAVTTECLFADSVADIAVLGPPDEERFAGHGGEHERYEELIETTVPLRIGDVSEAEEVRAWLLSLDGRWFSCRAIHHGGGLWLSDAPEGIVGGMSGSPILNDEGEAIGVMSNSDEKGAESGPNPRPSVHLSVDLWREIINPE